MPQESVLDRINRLIAEAVRSGRFRSRNDFLEKAGISTGYLAEFRGRTKKNPGASLTPAMARTLATALGVPVSELLGEPAPEAPLVDVYEERAWAVKAARALQYPEAAIQLVLMENPGRDPGRMYWFRRIEAEAERIRPASQL
jgi:transcriptional regulator with XRE-family HTH domain